MVKFLDGWVTNIVVLVIFISFLEIILPSSNMKRYINMIIGLLVIIVIINPFINLLTEDINIEREVFSNIFESSNVREDYQEDYSEVQKEQVIELYKDSLKKEIINLVKNKTKYNVGDISIEIIEDSDKDNFGEICSVSLIIYEKSENSSYIDINVETEQIQEVTININNSSSDDIRHSNQFPEIQELISDSYRIPKNNINIIKQHSES